MSNHISRIEPDHLFAAKTDLPQALENLWATGADDVARGGEGLKAAQIPQSLLSAARVALPEIDCALGAAREANMVAWLKELKYTRACREAPTDDLQGLAHRYSGMWAVCRDIPIGCWTRETVTAWGRESIFWPLPATLFKFMERQADELRRRQNVCKGVIRAAEVKPPQPEGRSPPDEGEIARVRELVAQITGHTTMDSPVGGRFPRVAELPKAEPKALIQPARVRLAQIEREIASCPGSAATALKFRAERLREQIAREAQEEARAASEKG